MVYTVGVESLILEEERLKLSNKSICKYREKKAVSSQNVSKAPETVSSFRSSAVNKILCSINEERADELILCSGVDIEILKRFTLSYLFSFF